MSREFPDFIDPWRAAEGGRRVGGTIPLTRFKRLQPMLASSEGQATFSLRFGFDQQRRATVAVEVTAALSLICQRSLEPYVEEVSNHSLLQVIGDQAEQALLSGDEEYVLVEEGGLAISDLVEDELLLAVPQVPRNPDVSPVWETTETLEDTGAPVAPQEERGRQRPFESLADLMKNR